MPRKKGSRSVYSPRMDHTEFQKWVEDMGYEKRSETESPFPIKMPYDRIAIAKDLGINQNRVYAYWRGEDKGKPILVSAPITKLCRALLELRRLRGGK